MFCCGEVMKRILQSSCFECLICDKTMFVHEENVARKRREAEENKKIAKHREFDAHYIKPYTLEVKK